jgi:hypothetical protein
VTLLATLQDSKWADYSTLESTAAAEPLPSHLWQQEADADASKSTASGGPAADGAAAGTKLPQKNTSASELRLDWQAALALLAAANATADRATAALASR